MNNDKRFILYKGREWYLGSYEKAIDILTEKNIDNKFVHEHLYKIIKKANLNFNDIIKQINEKKTPLLHFVINTSTPYNMFISRITSR